MDAASQGFGEALARGFLETLWDASYESGEPYLGDADDVESLAGWNGSRGLLAAALRDAGGEGHAGFVEEGGSPYWPEGKPGTYRIHDLWDHAPDYVRKRRAREHERQQKGAALSAAPDHDQSPTGHRPPNGRTRTPAPSPSPSPTHGRQGGRAETGPLGRELLGEVAAGVELSLSPLKTQQEADELERLVGEHQGVEASLALIARTCRERSSPGRPYRIKSAALVVTMLREVAHGFASNVGSPIAAPEPAPAFGEGGQRAIER